jgi:hypothetical protein
MLSKYGNKKRLATLQVKLEERGYHPMMQKDSLGLSFNNEVMLDISWNITTQTKYNNVYKVGISFPYSSKKLKFKVPGTVDYVFRSSQLFGVEKRKWIMKSGEMMAAKQLLGSSRYGSLLSYIRKKHINAVIDCDGTNVKTKVRIIDKDEKLLAFIRRVENLI